MSGFSDELGGFQNPHFDSTGASAHSGLPFGGDPSLHGNLSPGNNVAWHDSWLSVFDILNYVISSAFQTVSFLFMCLTWIGSRVHLIVLFGGICVPIYLYVRRRRIAQLRKRYLTERLDRKQR